MHFRFVRVLGGRCFQFVHLGSSSTANLRFLAKPLLQALLVELMIFLCFDLSRRFVEIIGIGQIA